jgi:hypothetical protein
VGLKVYRPRKSRGWLSLSLLVLPFLLLGGFLTYLYVTTGYAVLLVIALPLLSLQLPFLVILFGLPSMRYELYDEKLVMKCSLLKYVVPLASIKRITKRDLEITLWRSFRLPGLALFTVPYADVGRVKMCATSMSKGIVLIETDRGVYGITPLDEKGFIADLRSRVRS